ncbi:MAG: helix-turn-helix domain-containing protein [Brachybacterium tyrofermentans]|uniref:helix-turn-helix domain-containing protein n=1 Tax=Brachybacterium tyrofermentans TaxID=47848 RepID=UPI003F908635
MHAYLRFIRTEMDKRGWTAADLSRASGLSRQHLSRILGDDRSELQRKPEGSTIDAFAKAFGVSPDYVLAYVAEAMGFPSSPISAPDASALSDDELIRILAERLRRAHGHGGNAEADGSASGPASNPVEDPAQPDGITAGADERPWEREDFGLAAKRGRNRGREARERQDREGEEGVI